MKLSTMLKIEDDNFHRVLTLQQTYQRVCTALDRIGVVVNIQDMTDYDSVGIPIWAVQQQKYHGSSRIISYGKGVSSLQSQVSALMEAVERYSAEHRPQMVNIFRYSDLQGKYNVLEPQKITHGLYTSFAENTELEWVPGFDLFTQKEIWVPVGLALLNPEVFQIQPHLFMNTGNGLASGNVLEEAICHGLCEMIERDAWTLFWMQTVMIPKTQMFARQMIQNFRSDKPTEPDIILEANLFPEVEIESLPDDVRQLVAKFERAGVMFILRDITSDIKIPTFLAASREIKDVGTGIICRGMGSHPNARLAAIRAITECAQVRLAASQRFDLKQPVSQYSSADIFGERVISAKSETKRYFSSIINYSNHDILEDIKIILHHLSVVGLHQVIVVDLTIKGIDIPVVRVFIPGIENWSTFDFSSKYCTLGHRGRKLIELS